DDVHQWAALDAGEDGGVELFVELGVAAGGQNQAAARAAQGLVGGGGDDVGMRQGAGVLAASDEAGDVGHVDEEPGADGVGNLAHAGPVDGARVGGKTTNEHFRLMFVGEALDLVVVEQAGVGVDAVLDGVVLAPGEVGGGAVGHMAAGVETHAENGVAGLDQGEEDGGVGLGAGVGLDVGVVAVEQLAGAVNGELFDDVDVFAAAVEALAGVAFGVFVGELRALGGHDLRAGVVLRGDQFDVLFLTPVLGGNGGGQIGVDVGQGLGGVKHGHASLSRRFMAGRHGVCSLRPLQSRIDLFNRNWRRFTWIIAT